MFKEEARLMLLVPFTVILLVLLAALIVPSYLGRAKKAACLQRSGTWVRDGCELPETRPPSSAEPLR